MDALVERVAHFIRRCELLVDGELVVVGLSGGVDSMVLSAVLLALGYPIRAVHVNFRLRGAASEEDEMFVRAWCSDRGVELVVRFFDTEAIASERGESIQQTARALRYEAFEEAAKDVGVRRVALGHHRDDQAETLLLNLFRGAGPEGLAGMPAMRPIRWGSPICVVRPLLDLRREEIEVTAREANIAWREDATNPASKYRRGALRSEILPLIARHFGPAVVENIARSADLMRAYVREHMEPVLEMAFQSALTDVDGRGAVDLAALEPLPQVVRQRVLLEAARRWLPDVEADFRLAEELDDLTASQTGRRLVFTGGTIWRERDRLLFGEEPAQKAAAPRLLEPGRPVEVSGGQLTVERCSSAPDDPGRGAPYQVYLDARAVHFPLTVRRWEAGDRFVPLGMDREKKLSDFLTDERVPPHRKADVPVVVSGGRIVWVVPLRISQEARLRDDSVEAACLRFIPDPRPRTNAL